MKFAALALCALTASPLAASTIPAEWVGTQASLVYDFTAEITIVSDDVFFGLGDPPPAPSADATPFFGIAEGDVLAGSLLLDLTFEDGFVTVTEATCSLGAFDCLYNDIQEFELLDPLTGAGRFQSSDFANSGFLDLEAAGTGENVAEWDGTSDMVVRFVAFDILGFDVAGLPPLAVVPTPATLPLLGGALLLAGAGMRMARRRGRF